MRVFVSCTHLTIRLIIIGKFSCSNDPTGQRPHRAGRAEINQQVFHLYFLLKIPKTLMNKSNYLSGTKLNLISYKIIPDNGFNSKNSINEN